MICSEGPCALSFYAHEGLHYVKSFNAFVLIQTKLIVFQLLSFLRKQESRNMLKRLDSRLRVNDKNKRLCELI